MDVAPNLQSARSKKARIARRLSAVWRALCTLVIVLFLLGGMGLLVIGSSWGWFVLTLTVLPSMILIWYQHDLRNIKVSPQPKRVDDILDPTILGSLSNETTLQELILLAGDTRSGRFLAARAGLSAKFVAQIIEGADINLSDVWAHAWQMCDEVDIPIEGMHILSVTMRLVPGHETLLSRLQLDWGAIIDVMNWYSDVSAEIADTTPRKTGGIARDWAFGWTPLLDQFGRNISRSLAGARYPIQSSVARDTLSRMYDIFSARGRQNATLVGGSGSGKNYVIEAFAARLVQPDETVPSLIHYNQVFLLDAGALIAAAPGRGDLEALLPDIINEAYNSKNIIIFLDNAQLFFEEGIGSLDISNVLLEVLTKTSVKVIMTMNEQRYLQISQRHPEIASALNIITMKEPSREETLKILQREAFGIENRYDTLITYQAIVESYVLSERYVYEDVMPGKAVRLLDAAAQRARGTTTSAVSVQEAVEQTFDVKISAVASEDERDMLLNLEDQIHQRMIGQENAVRVVSDALRRARAGIRNQGRPIGTFLFLGPTGVGKSELAKALADIYYQGEDKIIRIDMNEYVSASDVVRLIADGVENPYSLTAQVRKQPFSVVLLDEIEKAHKDVINTLLQVLDEGVLRDVNNREINFRDTIIIATSNAGATRIQEYIARGYDIRQFEGQLIDEIINEGIFVSEFVNRFDEAVVFRPLGVDELLKIVDIILANLNKTLEAQKIIAIVDEDAKRYLVEQGNDVRFGARPMRRIIQRAVESIIAKRMLEGNVEAGDTVTITLEQVQKVIETRQ